MDLNVNFEKELKSIEKKADLLRDIHSLECKKYRSIYNCFSFSIIAFSSLISVLAVTDPKILGLDVSVVDLFRTAIAALGFLIFLISLYDKVYGINEKVADHEQAVKLLTDFITESRTFRNVDMDRCGEVEVSGKMDHLRKEYSQINQVIPVVPNSTKKFLKIKQNNLIKKDLSKKLDGNPFINIKEEMKKSK
ncbi:MAG: hypothetical protein AB3K77_03700 [Methanosarcinaceae archaeon]